MLRGAGWLWWRETFIIRARIEPILQFLLEWRWWLTERVGFGVRCEDLVILFFPHAVRITDIGSFTGAPSRLKERRKNTSLATTHNRNNNKKGWKKIMIKLDFWCEQGSWNKDEGKGCSGTAQKPLRQRKDASFLTYGDGKKKRDRRRWWGCLPRWVWRLHRAWWGRGSSRRIWKRVATRSRRDIVCSDQAAWWTCSQTSTAAGRWMPMFAAGDPRLQFLCSRMREDIGRQPKLVVRASSRTLRRCSTADG